MTLCILLTNILDLVKLPTLGSFLFNLKHQAKAGIKISADIRYKEV